MSEDSEEPKKEKTFGEVQDEIEDDFALEAVDVRQLFQVSNDALEKLKLWQSAAPNILESLKKVSENLTPKLEDLAEVTKNITFPQLDQDTLSKITVTPPFMDSLQSNSVLIEQQKKAIDLLNEILDEVRRLNESQRRGIKKMTKTLIELVEDGRINGPVFDLMKQLCLEWFSGDELPDDWK